jgi:inorganic pyrophosphatase
MPSFPNLGPFDKGSGCVNAIIDTPKGSRNKFKFDERLGLFRLGGTLPVGSVFPFDFGYVPSTQGGDGDPLDVLIPSSYYSGGEDEFGNRSRRELCLHCGDLAG